MINSLAELAPLRQKHEGQKLVLTSGTFDLFHVGHLDYLQRVKQYGDIVLVLLSGDKRVQARKGPSRPIIPEADRAKILEALRVVDYVMIDPSQLSPDQTDPIHAELLEQLQPDFYVTDGPDPRFVNLLDASRFVVLDRSEVSTSTTAIIERISQLP